MSLIDAIVPETVENRRKELQQQHQQQQQQQSSSTGTSVKNEAKLLSRTLPPPPSTHSSNINDKDRSPMHQPTNTSPQSTHPIVSDRSNMDSSTTNGGMNYSNSSMSEHGSSRPFNSALSGRSHSPIPSQTHYSHNHPPSSSHSNTLQTSASAGHFSQVSNGNDNNSSHLSYSNSTNHIASKKEKKSAS